MFMKTIVIYSYKGGVGKSLAAANFAVLLSRLGRTCALVDLDFEGPSLHTKFRAVKQSIPGNQAPRGFLSYIMRHVTELSNPHQYPVRLDSVDKAAEFITGILASPPGEGIRFADAKPLQEKKGEEYIEACRTLPADIHNGFNAPIHVIPAGDTLTPQYWPFAMGLPFRRVTGFQFDFLCKTTSETFYKAARRFFEQVKQRISELQPSPDYLIVELKSGSHEIATSILSVWADVLLCLFGNNEENREYLKDFLPRVRAAGVEIVPVLCRVPYGRDYRNIPELQEITTAAGKKPSDLQIIHSDREMEIREQLVLGLDGPPRNCRLTKDYICAFAAALRDAGDSDYKTESAIRDKLNLRDEDLEEEKRFILKSQQGLLINPSDRKRNVSFKQETFQLLLDGLKQKLSAANFNEALASAGYGCGLRFGETLGSSWEGLERLKAADYRTVQADIQEWSKFDSDVGLGRFQLDLDKPMEGTPRHLEGCTIRVLNSFLVKAKSDNVADKNTNQEEAHTHCRFMEGYIAGVFRGLFGGEFSVEHSIDDRESSCKFRIKRKSSTSV
jgi:hypothetical protein